MYLLFVLYLEYHRSKFQNIDYNKSGRNMFTLTLLIFDLLLFLTVPSPTDMSIIKVLILKNNLEET